MSKRKSFHSLCAVLLALCLGWGAMPVMAQSQASTGQITGSVTDNQGAAIANAAVKANNTQTGLSRTANTGDEGLFAIVLLPPGIYDLSVEASGFASTTVRNVEVVVGRSSEVKIALGVSGVQEVVSVTAGSVQVQTTRSESDSVLNERAIENLPINGRRFHDFINLTPTAQTDPSRGQISLSGQRGINTQINVDGTDYSQPFFGGIRGGERANTSFTIPLESIKEFQVIAAGYSAEFGGSTGGVVNAVTKSGTNGYHGSGFYLHRPKELARNHLFFDAIELSLKKKVTPAPTQQQWGGSFGGPIVKDKLFFFGSYEQQRFRNQREVFFGNIDGFIPTAATQEAFDFYKSLQEPFSATNDGRAFLIRGDYEISTNHRANARYSHSTNEALNSNSVGNALFPTTESALSNNGTEQDSTDMVVGQMTSFFSTSFVNELRGQYAREERPRPANALQPNVTSNIGRFGTVSFLGENIQSDWRVQFADNVTWSRGQHTAKLGGEFTHTFVTQKFGFNQFGAFSISGTNSATILDILSVGGATANRFDSSTVTYLRQIGNLQASYSADNLAFFGQDSWRIRPNFTVNFGMRWEGQYNPTPEATNDIVVNKVKGFRFPSGHVTDPTIIPNDLKQFGPRGGIAWDPFNDGKTVIRAHGGVYYARTPMLLLAGPMNNYRNPPGDVSVLLPFTVPASNPNKTVYQQFKLIGIDLNNFTLDKLPILTPQQVLSIAQALGLQGFDPFFGAGLTSMANDYRNPKSYQMGAGVERQLAQGLSVGADFSYVHAVRLERNRDLNIPLPIIRATDPAKRPFFGLRSGTQRPISTLGQVQVRESTGRSLFRALVTRLKFERKWGQINAGYTLSKSLSDDDNERDAGGAGAENSFNLAPEYGPSRLDRRHQFGTSVLFFLPHGIDLMTSGFIRSGRPIDAGFGSDANEDRGGPDRPSLAPGVPFQRNMFTDRKISNVDLRVQKRLNFGESRRLVLSFEVFNLSNNENIQISGSATTNYCSSPVPLNCGFLAPSNPNFLSLRDNSPSSARFGSLITTNDPGAVLQVQFGARFHF
jgi:hypothetical protein